MRRHGDRGCTCWLTWLVAGVAGWYVLGSVHSVVHPDQTAAIEQLQEQFVSLLRSHGPVPDLLANPSDTKENP